MERHRVAFRRQASLAVVRATTTTRCPTASSTTGGCPGARCSAPRSSGRSSASSTRARNARRSATPASCRRSRPTSTCARPSTRCSRTCSARLGSACEAWTRASGTTRSHDPEHFIAVDELLWSFADIVAKGGNLLLNVGPRGVDAQIPDEQRERLDALGSWLTPRAGAVRATRPWVTPGTTTPEGAEVRYTARDDDVFAFVRDATGSVTLPDVLSTPTTSVTDADGKTLPWAVTHAGTRIELVGSGRETVRDSVGPRHRARFGLSAPRRALGRVTQQRLRA